MRFSRLIGGLAAAASVFCASATTDASRPDSSAAALLAAASIEFAPPAESAVIVRQPDGKTFRAQISPAQLGGELELNGYTVVKGADGWWRYARTRGERGLVASAAVAGVSRPPDKVPQGVGRLASASAAATTKQLVAAQLQSAARLAARQSAKAAGPVEFRFPVMLLATWWDSDAGQTEPQFQPDSDTPAHFAAILDGFGGNPSGSLTEFYFENSHGQFLVKVDVHGPFVSQRSREDRCYYGDVNASNEPVDDLDPIDNALPGGGGAAGMTVEVTPQADPTVNFAVYDNDGDGYVDFMGIVHSGPDMATTGDPCHTWSHALPISAFGGIAEGIIGLPPGTLRTGVGTNDGVLIDRVFTMPEFAEPGATLAIGVATHEMAHALGEPDYYATNSTSSGDGDWDIMSGGSYMGNPSGTNPAWFNPASRVFQGWETPTIVHGDVTNYRLAPREAPLPGYIVGQPNPNLLLIPVRWIKVGETDDAGHEWNENDVYGLVLDGDRGYVIEGWYVEYASRMAGPYRPLDVRFTRSPYFDRGLHGSGVFTWHFDYWRRSNVYFGNNDAQNDANRMQMDIEEFDFYDNSQDVARNLHRGEPSDPFLSTATGITSGTHQVPPGAIAGGTPQDSIALSGTTTSEVPADAPFTVDDNPANHTMRVRIVGDGPPPGDCTLQLFRREGEELQAKSAEQDSGFVGDEEVVVITQPEPGEWVARVADFAACTRWTGSVTFTAPGSFDTRGSADTWSNETQAPTGWAITNIRGGAAAGLDFGADSGRSGAMVIDVLQLAGKIDVSPGYALPAANAAGGRGVVTAGRANAFSVPVFSNGGVAPGPVRVSVRRVVGTSVRVVAAGEVTLGAYERKEFAFTFDPGAEGPYELITLVDPLNALVEGSERNNRQAVSGWAGPRNPVVLVVDDEGYTDGEDAYTGALAALGVPYAVATAHVDAATMAQYEAVIWVGAIDRGPGQLDAADRAEIATYLGGGGRLWLASNRAAGAIEADGGGAFLAGWFGADSLETTTLEKAYVVAGTPDFLPGTSFELQPYPVRPFSDVVGVAAAGVFGNAAQILTLAQAHKPGRDGSSFGVRVLGDEAHGSFRSVLTPFSLGQATTAATAIRVTRGVLQMLGIATGRYTVTSARPLIYHVNVRQHPSGTEVPMTAIALGGSPFTAMYARFRRHGQSEYLTARLPATAEPGAFAGVIRARYLTPSGMDYYLRARESFDPLLAKTGALNHAISSNIPRTPAE